MISKTSIHALRALAALAQVSNGDYAGAGDIASAIGAPRNYLGKLLKALSHEGLVESHKGKGGGFRLARDPATITLLDVMEPIARVDRWTGCFLGRTTCSDDSPCLLHVRWAKARDAYFQFLKATTVADLATQFVPNSPPMDQ
ncbi:MAG: Rrf2 family transcriptional regulator [candidate division NC10 bacterium]|nr:Rrf2 family transcriptional regulator [candidate division NC10 bacterium]MBP2672499.1 Rrf2 family transcriptional regulator [candidate division NC10 bacterium]